MKNTLIVNGDVVMNKNIIETSFSSSITYAEKNSKINE
jgi:CTP:phosphocholine cytidylyltransferase-like protein